MVLQQNFNTCMFKDKDLNYLQYIKAKFYLQIGVLYKAIFPLSLYILLQIFILKYFLPFLIHQLGWRKSVQYFFLVGSLTLVLFYPLLGSFFIENFGNSLNLYFQKFEFNASLYYVLRWFGFSIKKFSNKI